jgi:predicted ATP-grasp superfamily ATP-dependent carboligase
MRETMPSKKQLRILLLDGDTRQTLPVAKALRSAGHYVTVLCEKSISSGAWSRYPHRRIFGPSCTEEPEAYLEFLISYLHKHAQDITIPLFDPSANLASLYKEELTRYTRVPIVDYGTFILARDKQKTMKMCAQAQVPYPATYSPEQESMDSIIACIEFPCLIKPNVGRGAMGLKRVERAEDLQKVYEEVRRDFGPCCIQEFIPQTGMQYKAQLFRSRQGRIHGAVVFNKVRYFPITGGTSSFNSTVDRPDIIADCTRLLETINWSGHADVDLIEDPRDGKAKVMEINPRITGSIKIAFEAGVDFAELLVRYAMEEELPVYNGYRVGVQMRYMPLDILWFLYSHNRWRAKPNWFKFWGKDLCYQEGSLDDPLPTLAILLDGLMRFLNPKVRKGKLG